MRNGIGQLLMASAILALGVLVIVLGDVSLVWTVPKTLAVDRTLARCAGVALLACGLGMLFARTVAISALAWTLFWFLKFLLLNVRQLLAAPGQEISWYACGETLFWVAGSLALYAIVWGKSDGLRRTARIAFGVALVPIGLSHFFYMNLTVPLIPAWMPFRQALAIGTGAAHIAAGIAVLLNIVPLTAARLEALMMSLFTLIIWIPAVIKTPHGVGQWSELCISTGLSGAAWCVARTIRRRAR